MSIITYLDAADTLASTLENIGHGAYVREDRDETAVIYDATMSRFALLFDNDGDVWATTDGEGISATGVLNGAMDDDAVTLIALWLSAETDLAAKAAYDAITSLEDWGSVVSDLSAYREGLSGVVLQCQAGPAQVDISFGPDSLAFIAIDVDPHTPSIDLPTAHVFQVGGILEAISNHGIYLDALIEALAEQYGIDNYVDAIGEFSDVLEISVTPDQEAAVIVRGTDVVATVTGDGPWTVVDALSVESTTWNEWTEMVAHIMTYF